MHARTHLFRWAKKNNRVVVLTDHHNNASIVDNCALRRINNTGLKTPEKKEELFPQREQIQQQLELLFST